MARSVEELRLESERSRATLAATVEVLKERITDTADDVRQKVSPEHIKAEVSDYISHKTQNWLGALKQQAMDNPMQAVAAGTAVAVPILRLARGFPLPLLMIGAGLALTSKTVRSRAAEAAAPLMDTGRDMLDKASERAQQIRSTIADTAASLQNQASDASEMATGHLDDLGSRTSQTASMVTDRVGDGLAAARSGIERARSSARETVGAARDAVAAAPVRARQLVGENAALIGGIGIAIGAIVAAALPKTNIEAKAMGGARDSVKQAAMEATQSGFEAAKETTLSAADAAARRLAQADLGAHASRMTQNMADTLKEAAEDVVTAALDPDQKPNI